MLLRPPSDVPPGPLTALLDLCRRSGAVVDESTAREALGRLSPDEDAALVQRCRETPAEAGQLSPHGVIDLLRGLPLDRVHAQEAAGHYRGVAVAAHEELVAGPTLDLSLEAQARRLLDALRATEGDENAAAERLGLVDVAALRRFAEKLGILGQLLATTRQPLPAELPTGPAGAPLRRPREVVEARKAAADLPSPEVTEAAPQPRPGRTPATPQFGRFVGGRVVKRGIGELEGKSGREEVAELCSEMRGNRAAIVERLELSFARRDAAPISEEDLEKLLTRHDLVAWFQNLERENLKALLRQNRGHVASVARTLRLRDEDVARQIDTFGLAGEAEELRERTREEAHGALTLAAQLELLVERPEQLRDAGAFEEVAARARPVLLEAMKAAAPQLTTPEPFGLLELARRALSLDARLFKRACRRLLLVPAAHELLGLPPPLEEERRRAAKAAPKARPPRPVGTVADDGPPRLERPEFGDVPRDERPPRYTDKSRGDRPGFGGKPRGRPTSAGGPRFGDKPRFDKPRGDRPSFGDKPRFDKPRGDRPSFGDRPRGDRPSFGDKPRGDRPSFGDKPRFDKPRGDRPSFGDKPRFDKPRSDRPSFGDKPRFDKPRSDRPSFGDRPPRSDRPSFGDKPRGDRPSFGDKPRFDKPRSDRPSFGDKPRGDRPSFGDRPPRSDRPSFGDKPRGDRPSFGDKPRFDKPRGDRPSFGDKPRFDKPRGDRPSFGDRPPRSDRPSFGDKPRGDRPSFGDRPRTGSARPAPRGDRPSFGDKPRGDRPSFAGKPRPGGSRPPPRGGPRRPPRGS